MFKKFSDAYKIVSNLAQIQVAIGTAFVAITKTADILAFILEQTTDTKLGTVVKEYLPPVISVLGKLKDLILKYGPFIGFTPETLTETQSEDKLKELKELTKSLDGLLK